MISALKSNYTNLRYVTEVLKPQDQVYRKLFAFVFAITVLPLFLNLLGVNFGIVFEFFRIEKLRYAGNANAALDILHYILRGSFIHTMLEWTSICIAIATCVFSFLHYRIKKDNITPIIGTTLLCAGLLDGFHLLTSDRFIIVNADELNFNSVTWVLCRIFNASIIFIIALLILERGKSLTTTGSFPVYLTGFVFLFITLSTILVFVITQDLPEAGTSPDHPFISQPYELIPMLLFLILAVMVLPRVFNEHPSVFSFTLFLSMLPAIATQAHASLSVNLYDNHFNIAHFLKAFSYAVPLAGLGFDYVNTHKKEKLLVRKLNDEIIEKEIIARNLEVRENLYRTLAKNIPNSFVLMFDKNLRFSVAEGDELRIYGLNKRMVEGKTLSELIAQQSWNKSLEEKYKKALNGEKIIYEEERGGNYYEFYVFPIHEGNKNINAGMVMCRNITDLKMYHKQLETNIMELKRSNGELEQFAYVASHDLQEPLRKIMAFGDRLKSKCGNTLNNDGRDYIDRMHKAAARMQTLIVDLLNFSRVTRHKNIYENVNLNQLVSEVLSDIETAIVRTEAIVKVQPLPQVKGDARQLRQLFQNLISNAVKFGKPGTKPEIEIKYENLDIESKHKLRLHPTMQYIKIAVADNGIGFDMKYLDRIFTIFQRLHGREDYEGTGIGLAICRKVAENHGGALTAKSNIGEGATFQVILPVKN